MGYHNLIQQEVQQEIIQTFEDYFVTQTNLSIVQGTAEYSLPSGFIKMRRVEDIRNSSAPMEILPTSLNQRQNSFVQTMTSQALVPQQYYIRGSQLVLTDTPTYTDASAIRLHFLKSIPDVTAGSNSSELPAEHHRVLVWGMVKLALFQQQSDTTLANQEFEKHLQRIKVQAENRQIQRPRKVVRTQEQGYL
jgi:hypothetical protein